MDYWNAFWVGGVICAIVQLLMEKTKMMPGRIMVLLVCTGAVLGALQIYEPFSEWAGAGANVPLLGFVYLDTVTDGSKLVSFTLKDWLMQTDAATRERVVDAIYTVFAETHVHTVKELGENWYMTAKSMIKTFGTLDEPTKALVNEAMATLMKSARIGFDKTFRAGKEKQGLTAESH